MAQVIYADGIKTVRGALDTVKDGQANRARWISRLRWQGENSIAPDGSIWHEFYRMHMHEGAWSDRATRNRNIIKAAQRMAHDIEHVCYHPEEYGAEDIEQAEIWKRKYAEYMETIPKGSTQHYKFYGWMFTEIYRGMRREAGIE